MAFRAVQQSKVPAFDIADGRIKAVSAEISISETAYDFDRGLYCLRLLGPGGRHADLYLSREILEDLRDNVIAGAIMSHVAPREWRDVAV